MSPMHPLQKKVPVFTFTPAGWIRGNFHVPAVRDLVSYLNTPGELLKLTDVVLPGSKQPQLFLALHKSAALLVVPQQESEPLPGHLGILSQGHHLVTCLLSLGSVRGYLKVPKTMRVSDFLLNCPGFIELYQCHLGTTSFDDPIQASGETWPLVLANSKVILGMAEE